MCGIVGYIGKAQAAPILLDGLHRLEYRGYDSAGLATLNGHGLDIRKSVGRIQNLSDLVDRDGVGGSLGISHTRWATHGAVTNENAHPHFDQSGKLALVHNGVIENYQQFRDELIELGHTFRSQTDTEVLAHYIGMLYDRAGGPPSKARLVEAVRATLNKTIGAYGLAIIHADLPDLMIGVRRGSPLALGLGKEEHFLASDPAAFAAHTREVVYLNDFDMAVIERAQFEIRSLLGGGPGNYKVSEFEYSGDTVKKGDYPHFMLKEIFEQPDTVRDAMRGRLSHEEATARLGGLNMTPQELRDIDRVILSACGSACHAALVGEYILESLGRVPAEVDYASEFRWRNMPLNKDTLILAISQSGETADTLAALREGIRRGHRVRGVCNNVASTIARESGGGVYMHAGPEIGVAATKSFTSQVVILALLALLLGRIRHLSFGEGLAIIKALEALPDQVSRCLELNDQIKKIAEKYANAEGMLFLGRQYNYPIALEGALKMKEISYINANGHPSGELKHGIIAMIRPEFPSIFIAPDDTVFEKNLNNIEQVKARKGPLIAVGTEGATGPLEQICDDVIAVPRTLEFLTPLLTVIPLQLFAYHTAVHLGCDVDKPRNLAKSVTVE